MIGSFDGADHDVEVLEGTLAMRVIGELAHATKSHHHQGVDRARRGSACQRRGSPLDGLVEAIELPERSFVLGVQWHPEADAAEPRDRRPRAGRRATRARARTRASGLAPSAADRVLARARPVQERAAYAHILGLVRRSSAIRAAAWGIVAAGVAAPLVRKRVKAPALLTQSVAYAAPLGLCVAMRRTRTRDVAVCALQMWAYLAAYKSPHDDPDAQEQRDALPLSDRRRPRARPRRAADRAPAARARAGRPRRPRMASARPRARVGALGLVHGARTALSPTSCCATPRASRARRR